MAATAFSGFPASGLAFLTELGRQDKAWFDANKQQYQAEIVAPTKAFVEALGERLADSFAPAIVAQPKTNGSIAPINNDLRFSPDKSPYKDRIMLRFWEGETKKTAPTLMIRLGQDGFVDFCATRLEACADVHRWLVENL
ncbi:MAG: DUF2461 family protein [Acidimicrobiales bacterium]|nr:DUF2461 family protein [Acidimicrobiales bacterium]